MLILPPNQLVFGHNVNTSSLSALEPTTWSEIISKTMDNLRNTRRNYIQAQNSDKIKRESKHYVRTNASEIYENGERVYFRKITDVGKVG